MKLIILKERCSPSECNKECLDVCPQNRKGVTAIKVNEYAEIIHKNCIECYRCITACPLQAISTSEEVPLTIEAEAKFKETKEKECALPIEINDKELRPFSEKMTVFARVLWDENFQGYKKPIFMNAIKKAKLGIDGYSEIELAAVQGAWALDYIIGQLEKQHYRPKTLPQQFRESLSQQQSMMLERKKEEDIDGFAKPKVKITDPKEMTKWLKKVAKFYGADLVGITNFDPKWVYTEDRKGIPYQIPDNIKFAIVIAVGMDIDAINTAPKMPSAIATGLGYSKMAFVRTLLSAFIESLGYEAIPAGNDLAISVPLAMLAGLGAYGRHGLLITKKYGPRVRIAKILTDLPLVPDKPDHKFIKSVERFCKVCKTCAKRCPSQSIPFDKEPSYTTYSVSNRPGIKKWYINVETCYLYWLENGVDCSRCIADCEYNHVYTLPHRIVRWIIDNIPILNPIWPIIGRVLGYGGNKSAKKFWKKIKVKA